VHALERAPVVVGASLGGLTALAAAGESSAPLVAAIVLVDIAPRVQADGVQRIVEFMRGNPDGFATLEEAADAIAGYAAHRPRPKDLSGLRKNLRLGEDGRYRWHWDPRMMSGDRRPSTTNNPDRMERCARALRVPTLLVRGRMSDIVSEEGARAFMALVPQARYADVSGAGHMVAGDRNDAFSSAVLAFLRDTDLR
jgi:pimeloyl-ACP methyl ester carboxylesterase